jgi:hypothetical protein
MNKQYAFIRHGVVENVGLVDTDTVQGSGFLLSQSAAWDAIESLEGHTGVGIGWHYDAQAGTFSAPPANAVEPEAAVRHVSVGAFLDRFGAQKWAILADTNPAVQALVKDCSVRKYIDLDRADLPTALALLQSAGHAIDATEILAAPVQYEELP